MHLACNLPQVERGCHHGVLMVDCHLLQLPMPSACRSQSGKCGNILYFWLVSEESFWLCAYLDERAEVVQCADSALVGACIFCFGEFNAGIHL